MWQPRVSADTAAQQRWALDLDWIRTENRFKNLRSGPDFDRADGKGLRHFLL